MFHVMVLKTHILSFMRDNAKNQTIDVYAVLRCGQHTLQNITIYLPP